MATNVAITVSDAFIASLAAMSRTVNAKSIPAFPKGVPLVPDSHLEKWSEAIDADGGPWCALILGDASVVSDENGAHISRAEVERITMGVVVVTLDPRDRQFDYHDQIETLMTLFNDAQNEIKADCATLLSGGTISDGPDGSYLEFGEPIERPGDLSDEFLWAGRRFTVATQYYTGRGR